MKEWASASSLEPFSPPLFPPPSSRQLMPENVEGCKLVSDLQSQQVALCVWWTTTIPHVWRMG